MLLILPVKFAKITYRLEEVFIDHILWPAFRVANNPIEFAGFIVNINHSILVATGES